LHKELLKACKAKANGNYFVGMPDLMEGLEEISLCNLLILPGAHEEK